MSKPRLPREAYLKLRKSGGAHSSKKGKKGYDRKNNKQAIEKEIKND